MATGFNGGALVVDDASTSRTNIGAAASGANTDITSVVLNNTGLQTKDTDASHNFTWKCNSNITANRTFNLVPGDRDTTIDMSAVSAGSLVFSNQIVSLLSQTSVANMRNFLGAAINGVNTDITSLGTTQAVQSQDFRPVNTQTGTTYTLVLADAGKMVTLSNASAITLTIPTNSVAFIVGTEIEFAQLGAGQVTFSPTGGVTMVSLSSNTKISGQNGVARLKKTATDTWLLSGTLSA